MNRLDANSSLSSPSYSASPSSTASFSYPFADSVRELDRQLAKLRSSPSKVLRDGKHVTIFVDMFSFAPEEIEVYATANRLTVRARATAQFDEKNSVEKMFMRKFVLESDIIHDTISTDLNKLSMLTIRARFVAFTNS
ncbi:hypothetical protein AB6A40_000086 [Gnathostoma spinigerum]|uniref:SHSP domain-containing protein n=1 Tax=Gnathostoma spinigerum TaxID=75299 RepID=A0ABD6E3G1_9BILA